MTYQGRIEGGEIAAPGERECVLRFESLHPVLGRFSRRITALDLGADCGYFGMRIAREYDAVSVMVEGGPQLAETCARERPGKCIALERRLSAADLEELATCEHFDVVLALNVLHHFGAEWRRALAAVCRLGTYVVIETPPPEDTGACGQEAIPGIWHEVRARAGETLGWSPSHTAAVERPMLLVQSGPRSVLTSPYVDAPEVVAETEVVVGSMPFDKAVTFPRKGDQTRSWIHGINLQTYLRRGGVYPSREAVAAMVEATGLPSERHGDIRPWNFILDGERVHLIDGRDDRAIYRDAEGLALTAEMVRA